MINITDPTSPVTNTGQLKLTAAEISYLNSFLDSGRNDRGGYYMALYQMTRNSQCLEQAQIATFSQGSGGTAFLANYLLQNHWAVERYPGVYYMSQQVAQESLILVNQKLEPEFNKGNLNTGYINATEMFGAANQAWANNGVADLFPGNILNSRGDLNPWSSGALPPPPLSEDDALKAAVDAVAVLQQQGTLSLDNWLDRLASDGALASVLALFGGVIAGKRLSDYEELPEKYEIRELPNASYKVAINKVSGKIVGLFDVGIVPTTFAAWLNFAATHAPRIATLVAGGPAAFLGVAVVQELLGALLVEFHRALSEDTPAPDFNGDVDPNVPSISSNISASHPLTVEGTALADTRWGTGGVIGVLYSDTLHGNGGDDFMFGGDGGDELHGGADNDVVYGQSGDDVLFGEAGADTLRGGTGDDILNGSDGNDVLDGGDITPDASGNDQLNGGAGNDILVGSDGIDILKGEADNDELLGGDGNDQLDGGSGNDTLQGMLGNDTMEDASGFDTYIFTGTSGVDTIKDSDGQGAIKVDKDSLNGGYETVPGTGYWQSSDKRYGYVLWPQLEGGETLIIYTPRATDSILVKNFQNGDLGIFLWDDEKNPNPSRPRRRIADAVNTSYRNASATRPPVNRDPLAIDLNGNGIETVGAATSPVLFDHNADGIKTGTGWVAGDDAWLVLDRDGNGLIDSGRELFGVDTLLSGTVGVDAVYAATGFEALRALDKGNGTPGSAGYQDGIFNVLDADFARVRLWRDTNSDGISQTEPTNNELHTLANQDIVSISLSVTATSTNLGNGNSVSGTAVVTRADSSTRLAETVNVTTDTTAANLFLSTNPFYREFPAIALTTQAAALPGMQGSGWVRDLREAMSLDTAAGDALAAKVAQFAAATTRDAQMALLDELLRLWAETNQSHAVPAADDPARRFALAEDAATSARLQAAIPVLEVFNGMNVDDAGMQAPTTSTVDGQTVRTYTLIAAQANLMLQTYDSLSEGVYGVLAMQTRLKPYLDAIELVIDDQGVRFDTAAFESLLSTNKAAGERNAILDLIDLNLHAQDTRVRHQTPIFRLPAMSRCV